MRTSHDAEQSASCEAGGALGSLSSLLAELQRRSGALCGSPTTFAAPRFNAAFGAERLPGIDVRAAAAAPIPGVAVDGECAGAIELINPVVGAALDDLALNDLVAACAMLPELLMLGAS